jgi:hypothetical protein
MRRALTGTVAAAVLVVAVTGGLAVSGAIGSAREDAAATRLDKLHAVRPVAAHRRPASTRVADGTFQLPPATVSQIAQAYRIGRYVAAIQLEARTRAYLTSVATLFAAFAPKPMPTPVQARRSTSSTGVQRSGGEGDFFACVRHHESRGNYSVVNRSSGAAGAYQFRPTTCTNAARSAGRPDLVGVNPAAASASDQDALAHYVYSTQGSRPWAGDGCR